MYQRGSQVATELWVCNMVLAACHQSEAWNLDVAYRVLENMRTPDAEDTGVDLHML
jgi:hypothetical protein